MLSNERFQNQLALNLSCQRLLSNNHYNIEVEYNDIDVSVVSIQGPDNLNLKVKALDFLNDPNNQNLTLEMKEIVDAVHQAYIISTTTPF